MNGGPVSLQLKLHNRTMTCNDRHPLSKLWLSYQGQGSPVEPEPVWWVSGPWRGLLWGGHPTWTCTKSGSSMLAGFPRTPCPPELQERRH